MGILGPRRRALYALPTGCHESVKIRVVVRHGLSVGERMA